MLTSSLRARAGWVREMYAWCVAVHKNGVHLTHELPPASRLMAQPPHDWTAGRAAFLHYTWGTLYHQDGKEIWRFDKRDWTAKEHELKVRQPRQPGVSSTLRYQRSHSNDASYS